MAAISTSELISQFTRTLALANRDLQTSVILVGSVARGSAVADSDLDLVVVSDTASKHVSNGGRLHVQYFTGDEFLERLRKGDDFAAWCVRFGVPLVASRTWAHIVASSEATTWPDWRAKLPHVARRLQLASSMLDVGDLDAAKEETLYGLTHVGRALLLKDGQFPLSRPEMVTQLRDFGHRALSDLLQGFIFHAQGAPEIARAVSYVKKLLVHLDRRWYSAYAAERRASVALKKRRPIVTA